MYCNKCGKENLNNAKFCSGCGATLSADSAKVAVMNNPLPPRDMSNSPVGSGIKISNERKLSKSKIIMICVAAFVAVAAIMVVVFLPSIERAILGDTKYYLYRESKTLENMAESEYLVALFPGDSFSATSTIKVNATVPTDSYYYGDYETTGMLSILGSSQINTKLVYSKADSKLGLTADLTSNKTTVASLITNVTADGVGLSAPGLVDGQYVMPFNNDGKESDIVYSYSGYSKKEVLDVALDIIDSVEKKCIKQSNIHRESVFIDGKKCNSVTYSFNESEVSEMVVAFCDYITSSDKAINISLNTYKAIAKEICKVAPDEIDITEEEIDKMDANDIREFFNDIRDDFYDTSYSGDEFVKYTVVYNSKNYVVSRTLDLYDGEMICKLDTKIDSKGASINLSVDETDYDCYTFSYSRTEEKGISSGKISLNEEYENEKYELFSASFSDLEVKKCGNFKMLVGSLAVNIDDMDIDISISSSVDSDNYNSIVKIDIEDIDVSVNISTQMSKDADVSSVSVDNDSTIELSYKTLFLAYGKLLNNVASTYGDAFYQLMGYSGKSTCPEADYFTNPSLGQVLADSVEQSINSQGDSLSYPTNDYTDYYSYDYYDDSTDYYSSDYTNNNSYIITTQGGKLNMRSGAGEEFGIVEQVPNGTTVTVENTNGNWAYINYNGKYGWVSMDFCQKA